MPKETNDDQAEILPCFTDFWQAYDKKVGYALCEKKWQKLTQTEREKIMLHVPVYVSSTPVKQYRKNPYSYLNQKSWNDEIIERVHQPSLSGTAAKQIAFDHTKQQFLRVVHGNL